MAGLIERIALATRYAFTGKAEGADWFGPQAPLDPVAQEAAAGRRLDYRFGVNQLTRPRDGNGGEGEGGIGFRELRNLADNCGIVRLVIETRKDQMAWRQWEIVPKEGMGAKPDDPDIKKIRQFLEYPDREHDFATWQRALSDEMMVTDAATIYPRYARNGELYSLDLIDGATIKCVIDSYGRRPTPPVAAYQQILKGLPAVDYTSDQLIYAPRNYRTHKIYGFPPTEQIILMINTVIRRDWHKLQYYTEGTVPDALAGVPINWNIDQIQEFQDYFDALLSDNTADRRKVRFVPETIAKAFVETKSAALKDEFDEWIARFVCYAFSVSAQWAIKQMNRSTAESAAQQAQEEGLAPLQAWFKSLMDRIIAQVFKRPDLQFSWKEDQAVDPAEQATIDDTNVKNGTRTINQVKASRGDDPVEGGDETLLFAGGTWTKLSDVLNPPPPPAPPQLGHNGGPPLDDGDKKPPPDPETEAGAGGEMAKAAGADDQDKMADLWGTYLENQADTISAYLATVSDTDQAVAGDAAALAIAEEIAARAIELAATAEERQALTAATTELLLEAGDDGIAEGVAMLGDRAAGGARAGIVLGPKEVVKITDLAHPDAVKYAETRGAELVSKIDETTRNMLRSLIAKAQESGQSVAQLADQVAQMPGFSAERAALIARTELAASSIRGSLASWIRANAELGINIKKRVILGLNENHCPVCLGAVHEGPIPLDDSFAAGYAAPFHPHCFCGLVPAFDDEKDDTEEDAMAKAGGNPNHDARGRFTSAPSQAAHDPAAEHARGLTAMAHVLASRSDHQDAMNAQGIGPVSFVWGEKGNPEKDFEGGWGLAKITAKHGSESALAIPKTLAYGAKSGGGARIVFTHEEHRVTVTHGGRGGEGQWVLSGYWPNR